MARVSRDQLRKIAPRGKAKLRAGVDTVRKSWPTDDFLAILNADLPDWGSADAISAWIDHAFPRFGETVAAMARFGEVAAPADWEYQVNGRGLALGPLVLAQACARVTADDILTRPFRVRRAIRLPLDALKDCRAFLRTSRRVDLDVHTRVALWHALEISEAVISQLQTFSDAWAKRLRRCPGPRCPAPYFWNNHDNAAAGKFCPGDACRKAHTRLSALAVPK